MKKVFLGIAALSVLMFSACNDDDNDGGGSNPNNLKGTAWEYVGYVSIGGDTVEVGNGSYPNEEFAALSFVNDTILKVGLRNETHELRYNVANQFTLRDVAMEPNMDIFYPDFYFCTENAFSKHNQKNEYLNLYVNKEIAGAEDSNVNYLVYENTASHLK